MSLNAARAELKSAKRAIKAMECATSFEIFESEWREFLSCLEKVWKKTERGCQSQASKFQPWQGQFSGARRKDQLLKYLKQARDADNHSIQDLTKVAPAHRTINFASGNGGHIDKMTMIGGQIVEYKGDPIVVEDHPPRPEAIRFKNQANWYNPSNSHLGKPISSKHPVELAMLGLSYYESFVDEAGKKFFNGET